MLTHTFYDKDFTCLVAIGTGQRLKDCKHYVYCEISYKSGELFYNQAFDSKYYDTLMKVYYMITQGLIPESEIVKTIRNIKKMHRAS